jgi:hypothetical protein
MLQFRYFAPADAIPAVLDTIVVDMEQEVSGFDVSEGYALPWDCRICLGLKQAKGIKDSSNKTPAPGTRS